jgi:hypothetical protein
MTSLPLLIGVLAGCGLVGAVPALVNALKPRLQERLQLDQDHVERLERMQFFLAWVAGMPLAGYLLDAWKPVDVFVIGCVGIAITLSFFGVTESPRWIGAMSFLLGLATSFVVVATVCLLPVALPAAVPAAALNAGFIAIGVGSFTPPLVLRRLEQWFGLRRGLLILGLGALIPVACVFIWVMSRAPSELPAARLPATTDFFHDVRFWLLAGMLILYYPIESALDIWSEPFLHEIGYRERTRSMLIGFWLAFLLARLAMWQLLGPRNEVWLLGLCAVGSAVVLGNLVGAYGASSGGVGFWLVGACYGPLLPGFLGLLIEYFPTTPGLAVGSVLALAGLHDALAQPLMARGTQSRSVRIAMRIPLLMTLLMLAPLLVIGVVKW